jgi:iron(III) transport system ATP-binding protein
MTTSITIDQLVKRFGATEAVRGVSLKVENGQLFFLLGPSGCGKTTLLRMIAGLTEPSEGAVRFGDRDVTRIAPNKRNVGMVFQSYALWPHMTVRQNVAFGLKVRKVSATDRNARVDKALEAVRMQGYAERKPAQLSGGQQQRVALARALVIEPDVLLLDEPLSNLDASLRLEMRQEIRRLCTETGITTVYVTHDQVEALSMADTVAVLRDGAVEQVGPPRELYDRPQSRFVAGFLGETNFLPARIVERKGNVVVLECEAGRIASSTISGSTPDSGEVVCSVRPESFSFVDSSADLALTGDVLETMFLGATAQSTVNLVGDIRVRVSELNPRERFRSGEARLSVDPSDVIVLPAED